MITKEQIIQDLKNYYNKYNRIPTKKNYIKDGLFSKNTIDRRFGCWQNALKETFNETNLQDRREGKTLQCHQCNKDFYRIYSEIRQSKSGFFFCSSNCACSYNNTQKRKSRRSKCEILLYELLKSKFSTLDIIPNDKTMLEGLEVDIAIPSLKLAIEWNGIVHFKPIYGIDKLQKIQSIDQDKLIIAQQKDINLIVIPDLVSKDKYVKECFNKISLIIRELQK